LGYSGGISASASVPADRTIVRVSRMPTVRIDVGSGLKLYGAFVANRRQ
jgi:hypothetical protein